jgi:hypothetical protein
VDIGGPRAHGYFNQELKTAGLLDARYIRCCPIVLGAGRVGAAIAGTPPRMRVSQDSNRKTIAGATVVTWQRWYYAQHYGSRWMALYRAPTVLRLR